MIIEKNGQGEITEIKLPQKDSKIYNFLSKQISLHKFKYGKIVNVGEKQKARSKWYHTLQKKDVWLRKMMMELKLYLKENKLTPGSSMFGTQRRIK